MGKNTSTNDTLSVTDNRTGKSYTVPCVIELL